MILIYQSFIAENNISEATAATIIAMILAKLRIKLFPIYVITLSEYTKNKCVVATTPIEPIITSYKGYLVISSSSVAMVPGPTSKGVANGTVASSSTSTFLVFGKPPNISIAIAISNIPPPNLIADMLIPKNSKIHFPPIVNIIIRAVHTRKTWFTSLLLLLSFPYSQLILHR